MSRNRFLLLVSGLAALILAVAAGGYAWMYGSNPCEVEAVQEASAFLKVQLKAYDDLYQFTTTVHQGGLAPPVNKLKQIYMDTQAVTVPACMQTAQAELLDYMETVIRAFQAFAAGEEAVRITDLVSQANKHYANFHSELKAINECAPHCSRFRVR